MKKRGTLIAAALGALALLAWLAGSFDGTPPKHEANEVGAGDAGEAPVLRVGAGRADEAFPTTAEAPSLGEELLVPLIAEAPPRLGVRFFAHLVKPRRPLEAMFSSGMAEDEGPAVGYPVRIYWKGPELIESPVLEGVTGEDGVCLLSPLAVPNVPHRLRGAVKLVVEGGGEFWEERSMSFDVAWLLENTEDPVPAVVGGPVIAWIPIGFEDWKGTPVSGRLLDAQGAPVPGVTITESKFHAQVRTDAAGRFSLRCPEGEIIFYGDSHDLLDPGPSAPEERFPSVLLHRRIVTAEPLRDLEFHLPEKTYLRGRVRFADGTAAAGVDVFLADDGVGRREIETVESRADGSFAFVGLRPGTRYEVMVSGDRAADDVGQQSVPGPELVELTVPRHQLQVLLVDAQSGRAVAGDTHVYDGDRYPGAKLLIVGWAPGYGPVERSYVMRETPSIQVVTLRLPRVPPEGALRVRCLAPDATRIENPPLFVRVVAESIAEVRWTQQREFTVTNDLGPGAMTVVLAGPGDRHPRGRPQVGVPGAGPARFLLGLTKKIQIPADGKLDVELRPALGGAMQFRVVIADKSKQLAILENPDLIDENGETVRYRAYQQGQRANYFDHATESSAVPVGTYQLRLRGKWHKPVDRVVQIEAGRLTLVDILVEANDE